MLLLPSATKQQKQTRELKKKNNTYTNKKNNKNNSISKIKPNKNYIVPSGFCALIEIINLFMCLFYLFKKKTEC